MEFLIIEKEESPAESFRKFSSQTMDKIRDSFNSCFPEQSFDNFKKETWDLVDSEDFTVAVCDKLFLEVTFGSKDSKENYLKLALIHLKLAQKSKASSGNIERAWPHLAKSMSYSDFVSGGIEAIYKLERLPQKSLTEKARETRSIVAKEGHEKYTAKMKEKLLSFMKESAPSHGWRNENGVFNHLEANFTWTK